jgi:hypothetical protein
MPTRVRSSTPVRPGVPGEGLLRRHCRRDGVGRALECDEERIALRVHFLAAVRAENVAQQSQLLRERGGVALAAEPLQEPRRSLDVRAEKRHRPARRRSHGERRLLGGLDLGRRFPQLEAIALGIRGPAEAAIGGLAKCHRTPWPRLP